MNIKKDIFECLPEGIKNKIIEYPYINEIRIRKNKPLCFAIGGKNYVSNYIVSEEEMQFCITKFCKNSVHKYFEDIKNGYIPYDFGYRIGVCGNAIVDKNTITNISEINCLNIRIPHDESSVDFDFLKNIPLDKGILIYSPPNYGKTTLLKQIIRLLSLPPHNKTLSVVDPKKELYSYDLHKNCPVDFFSGYPKKTAIDMAVRNMSPDIIVCDEIGLDDDTSSLIECKNSGVTLICSAHAKTLGELLQRKNIKNLHELNVFEGYIGISIKNNKRTYLYQKREDYIL